MLLTNAKTLREMQHGACWSVAPLVPLAPFDSLGSLVLGKSTSSLAAGHDTDMGCPARCCSTSSLACFMG
jgi:hypothetical protein